MADNIDFDELDRAVSSLIGKPPATTVPDTTLSSESMPDTSPKEVVSEEAVAPAPTADKIPVKVLTPVQIAPVPDTTPATRRAGGRFMDVVRPSSEMRTASAPALASSVEGAAPPVPAPTVAPSEPESSPASYTMPDPIDFGAQKEATLPAEEPALPAEQSTEPQVDNEAAQLDALAKDLSNDEPQESPFLPNAKVEKRPLGSFSASAPTAATNATDLITEVPDTSNDPMPPESQLVATTPTLRPSDDLVREMEQEQAKQDAERAEADRKAAETAKDAAGSEQEQVASIEAEAQNNLTSNLNAPLPAELQSDVLAIEAANVAATGETAPALASTGPASIVQQYKEKASSAKPSGAIYDTESYHKPLQHPAPKKSGWLILLVIIGIILVGGGVGAAVYFVGLPLLQR